MKSKLTPRLFTTVAGLIFTLGFSPASTFAQGTAFSYQGRLNDSAGAAHGSYDLRFTVFDNSTAGSQQGPILTNSATAVSNGLFTVKLDFGNQFPGAARWLEIGVRTNGVGSFFTLSPRQPLTPAPYAITAGNVISGGLTAGTYGNAVTFNNANNSFAGTFTGNGVNVTNVNAATLNGLTSAGFWGTNGNTGANPTNGAFLGTTDNMPLEFKVNGQRAWRLEPNSSGAPNVMGGARVNSVAPGIVGATIGGGGSVSYSGFTYINNVTADFGTIGGGRDNLIQLNSKDATIAGGFRNQIQINDVYATIGGGFNNQIQNDADSSTIGGGYQNQIQTNSYDSTISGGFQNQILTNGGFATIAGGDGNLIKSGAYNAAIGGGNRNQIQPGGQFATIPGGNQNSATNNAFAAGSRAKAVTTGTFVWSDTQNADFVSTANDQFLIRSRGGVGINMNNPNGASLYVQGGRANGWPNSVGWFENTTASGNAAPALRVVADGGNATDGALNVSANGTGLIARFGNYSGWVADIQTNGTIDAVVFNPTSDRNAKEHFTPINAREMLEKVAALPISEWNYRVAEGIRHIGPMAQDFRAAFGTGSDDKHIATVDADGVALAAIQGLNEKLEEQRAENADLKQQVAELKQLVLTLAAKH